MKEQWTEDLRNKMQDYESADIPEGLWAGIEQGLDTPKPVVVPMYKRWKTMAVAASVTLIIGLTCFYTLNNDDDMCVADLVPMESYVKTDESIEPEEADIADVSVGSSVSVAPHSRLIAQNVVKKTQSQDEPESAAVTDAEESAPSSVSDDGAVDAGTQNTDVISDVRKKINSSNALERDNLSDLIAMNRDARKANKGIQIALLASGMASASTDFASSGDMNGGGYYLPNYGGGDDGLLEGGGGMEKGDPEDSTSFARMRNKVQRVSSNAEHHMPVSIGLQVGVPLTDRISINSGLVYTYLSSDIHHMNFNYYQCINYLGVPVKLNYSIVDSKYWNVYLSAGGRIDFPIKSNAADIYRKINSTTDAPAISNNLFVTASAGVQYKVFKGLSIYVEPSLMRLVNTDQKYSTYYTDNNTVIDMNFGIRWLFGK